MNKIVPIRAAPKSVRSTMQTMIFDLSEIENWKHPPFQRPIKINNKVRELAEELKHNGGIITGVITLGKIGDDPAIWIVDGQHRCESFKISGLKEIIADIRTCQFDTMGEMATEFVRLQQQLVKMRPDDILRGMESTTPALAKIKEQCPFVGYDYVRRSPNSAILSMAVALRCWSASRAETPALSHGGSAAVMAETITDDKDLIVFLLTANAAWGRDEEFKRLWGNLNLTLCAWLYRRLVLDRDRSGTKRHVLIGIQQFKQCLSALSADGNYLDFLSGRLMSEHDRNPTYARIKTIFARRIMDETKTSVRPRFPQPAWASS